MEIINIINKKNKKNIMVTPYSNKFFLQRKLKEIGLDLASTEYVVCLEYLKIKLNSCMFRQFNRTENDTDLFDFLSLNFNCKSSFKKECEEAIYLVKNGFIAEDEEYSKFVYRKTMHYVKNIKLVNTIIINQEFKIGIANIEGPDALVEKIKSVIPSNNY